MHSKYSKSLPALHLHFAPWQRSGVMSCENKLFQKRHLYDALG